MSSLNIVLFEPQIPQNTGNIIRTCASTNAILHLVGPMGFAMDDKKLKRAGLDYWKYLDVRFYSSIDDFYNKNKGVKLYYFTTKAQNVYSDIPYPDDCYLVFGREDAGINEEILYNNKESCVRIPMQGDARSLNLSNTVAIAAYEVLRQWGFPTLKNTGSLTKYEWN